MVVRGLYSEVLEDFFSSVSPTEDSAISMYLHGALLARFPHAEGLMGTKLNTAPLFARMLAGQDHFTSTITSPIDGNERAPLPSLIGWSGAGGGWRGGPR